MCCATRCWRWGDDAYVHGFEVLGAIGCGERGGRGGDHGNDGPRCAGCGIRIPNYEKEAAVGVACVTWYVLYRADRTVL